MRIELRHFRQRKDVYYSSVQFGRVTKACRADPGPPLVHKTFKLGVATSTPSSGCRSYLSASLLPTSKFGRCTVFYEDVASNIFLVAGMKRCTTGND